MKVRSFFLSLILGLAAFANAQLPEPVAEVKALDWMLGEWSGNVKWTMMGAETEGHMTWKVEREGLYVKQTATIEMMGMKMNEVGYTGWDPQKKKYWSYTYANYMGAPRIEWGEKKGEAIVFTSEPWEAGAPTGPVTSRATLSKKGDDIHFLLESKNGDKWDKMGEGTFKKKKT